MIIFTQIKSIPIELLEYKGINHVECYNLSSYYSHVPTLNMLIPSIEYIPEDILTGDWNTPEFDIHYHEYIMNNTDAFIQFMNIIIPAYIYPDTLVQVLISNESSFKTAILESLLKLIQQRYGYNAYIINDIEDFLYADESDFSIPGLFAIDKDIERWQELMPIQNDDIQ